MFEEIECRITGRVQAVVYRDFAQRKARTLGIAGTVKNLSDGSVRVIAQGTPDQLKEYIKTLHEGSVLSRVEDVSVEWRSSRSRLEDFCILY